MRFLLVLLLATSVKAQIITTDANGGVGYSFDGKNLHRVDVFTDACEAGHLSYEYPFIPVSWTPDDHYNHDRTNVGCMFLIESLIISHGSPFYYIPVIQTMSLIPNSKLYWTPFNDLDAAKGFAGEKGIGLFVKSNLDFYVFRKNKWFNWSPGTGLGLFYNSIYLDLGLSLRIDNDFNKTDRQKSYFGTLGYKFK